MFVVTQGRRRLHLAEENTLLEVFILLFVAYSTVVSGNTGSDDCILAMVQLMQRWIKGKGRLRIVFTT